jgi:hypothetical protein
VLWSPISQVYESKTDLHPDISKPQDIYNPESATAASKTQKTGQKEHQTKIRSSKISTAHKATKSGIKNYIDFICFFDSTGFPSTVSQKFSDMFSFIEKINRDMKTMVLTWKL